MELKIIVIIIGIIIIIIIIITIYEKNYPKKVDCNFLNSPVCLYI